MDKPKGNLWIAIALCGCCGGLMAVVASLTGLLTQYREKVLSWIKEGGVVDGELFVVGREPEWAVAAGVALCVAFFVLDSHGAWRHVIIGLLSVVMVLGAFMSLALWGMILEPTLILLAVVAAWLSAVLYASQHMMPCVMKPRSMAKKSMHEEVVKDVEEEVSMEVEKPKKGEDLEVKIEKGVESPNPFKPKKKNEAVAKEKPKEKTSKPVEVDGSSVPLPKIGKPQKPVEKVVVKAKGGKGGKH